MNEKSINLLYTGNDYAYDGIVMSLLSIVKYTKRPLNVYILTMDLTDLNDAWKPLNNNHMVSIKQILINNVGSTLKLLDVSNNYRATLLNGKNQANQYTPFAMIRLFAHQMPELPDKILYLDTDTIACRDISELYDIDISNHEYGAVKDYYGKVFINPKYINTGVLLLNLKKIKETGLFDKTLNMVLTKKMGFPDQSALNKCTTKKLILSRKYNDQKRLHKDTVIRHFAKTIIWLPYFHTRNIKPWQEDKLHQYNVYWLDDLLNEYKNIKDELSQTKE